MQYGKTTAVGGESKQQKLVRCGLVRDTGGGYLTNYLGKAFLNKHLYRLIDIPFTFYVLTHFLAS